VIIIHMKDIFTPWEIDATVVAESRSAMADEFEAMKKIEETLAALDDGQRTRTLQWVWSRFADGMASSKSASFRTGPSVIGATASGERAYETFAELFDAANPTVERDKALVAAYWVQVCLNQQSFPSQTLNTELKDLGHGVGNITEALTQLKEERPAQILQLKKSGLSKQARKTYKLTQEGIKRVESMTRGNNNQNESD
jgi:hypothetical protein